MLKERNLHEFGEFSLDPVAKVLFRKGEPVHLTRKAVETLLVLVENAGRVLTKEEIITAVWAGRVVDEANLAQNIAVVRKALGAPKGDPAHIETFPGRGYRLEGPVTLAHSVLAVVPSEPPAVVEAREIAEEPPQPSSVRLSPPSALVLPEAERSFSWVWVAVGLVVIAGLAVAIWVARRDVRPEQTTTGQHRVIPVTRLTGKEYQPALSPDGQRIAFVWAEDGNRQPSVWMKPSGDGSPTALSREGAAATSPAWSPDGQSLAFLQIGRSETEIVIRSVSGGSPRTVAKLSPPTYGPDYRMLDWSPDGRTLAVSHSTGAGLALSIYLVDVASGEVRPLTQSSDDVGHLDPRFSPDGKSVSYIRLVHRLVQEIWSVPLTGGPAARLTAGGKRITAHDWTSGGRAIVFASDRTGEFRLWRQAFGGSGDASREPGATGLYSEFPIQFSIARQSPTLAYSGRCIRIAISGGWIWHR